MMTDSENGTAETASTSPQSDTGFDRIREQGTVPLLKMAGIPVRIHIFFIALILLYGVEPALHGGWTQALFLPAMLVSIAIHEFGHALAALRLGHKPRPVVFHPLLFQPTVARLLRQPRHEAWIALAGPAANGTIALLVMAVFLLAGRKIHPSFTNTDIFAGGLAMRFLAFNLLIAALNFLPIFPLDGGHALRAGLATRYGDFQATRLVVALTRSAAIFLGVIGIHAGSLFLCLVAVLLFFGAVREQFEAPITQARLRNARVVDAAETKMRLFSPATTVGEVFQSVRESPQSYFPILLGSNLLGLCSRAQILMAASTGKSEIYLSSLMLRNMTFSHTDKPLDTLLLQRLPSVTCPIVVTDNGTSDGALVALLTRESLRQWLIRQPDASSIKSDNEIMTETQAPPS